MDIMKEVKQYFVQNKEGAMFGAGVGTIFWALIKAKVVPTMAAVTPGILDKIVSTGTDMVTLASIKLLIIYVIVGACAGLFTQYILKLKVRK